MAIYFKQISQTLKWKEKNQFIIKYIIIDQGEAPVAHLSPRFRSPVQVAVHHHA